MNTIEYHAGRDDVACSSALIENALDVAKQVDYVVLVMGLDPTQEREKYDRLDLVHCCHIEILVLPVRGMLMGSDSDKDSE